MARVCQVTGKAPITGTIFPMRTTKPSAVFCLTCNAAGSGSESENRWVSMRLTNAALRTIDKNGIDSVLAEMRARGDQC